eukprot:Sro4_g003290.2  (345) ;mRNA; r:105969-107497
MKVLFPLLQVLLTSLVLSTIGSAAADDGDCSPAEGTCRVYNILGKPEEYTESTVPGVKLAVRRWTPDDVKSVVLFAHGGAGFHSGYSDIMGKSFQEAGIAVISYDVAGSGYSDGLKDKNGNTLRNYFDSMDTLTNDFTKVLNDVRSQYPTKKVFAVGESFGCKILLAQIMKEQEQSKGSLADGYVFSGPVVQLLPEMLPPKPVIAVMSFIAKFFPMLTMPGTDFFSTFDLAFGDKAWAQTGRHDPFVIEAASIPPKLGMIISVLNSLKKLNDSLETIGVPFKIFVGENEGRVDVDAIKRLAKVAKSTDKDIEIVPGAYHQLFQDLPEVTQLVCRHIQEWILARS